jgi:hypothetical protein
MPASSFPAFGDKSPAPAFVRETISLPVYRNRRINRAPHRKP